MPGPIFVDTNVLVYARDDSEPEKQSLAAVWMEHLWRSRTGRLSTQVLQEFYVIVTQKLKPGLDRESARAEIRELSTWRPIRVNIPLLEKAWRAQDEFRLSFWDSLIVAAAQTATCSYLLSEDLSDTQRFGDLEVANPFLRDPSSLVPI